MACQRPQHLHFHFTMNAEQPIYVAWGRWWQQLAAHSSSSKRRCCLALLALANVSRSLSYLPISSISTLSINPAPSCRVCQHFLPRFFPLSASSQVAWHAEQPLPHWRRIWKTVLCCLPLRMHGSTAFSLLQSCAAVFLPPRFALAAAARQQTHGGVKARRREEEKKAGCSGGKL